MNAKIVQETVALCHVCSMKHFSFKGSFNRDISITWLTLSTGKNVLIFLQYLSQNTLKGIMVKRGNYIACRSLRHFHKQASKAC